MSEAFRLIGNPRFGGILVVSDHASNHVPADIELGIDPALLDQHIAIDIGVAEVGALMAERPGIAAEWDLVRVVATAIEARTTA